ncbi:beta-1,3-galactosyltransferase 5 [Suncus etruscus]|uniref:beta-1,3-galactosyltransferase 5 n=1 Tax=Suncus etruscus TaxID=109475 RepID=UPI00210F823F|nr:beta-1,3-galactosyltransferase 5 [Suncus etruscus]
MMSLKMRLLYLGLVVLGALCVYFSTDSLTVLKQYFKRKNRAFLQLPDINCGQNPPFLVLLVTSSQDQASTRTIIRNTWGGTRTVLGRQVRAFFLLGRTPTQDMQARVAEESRQHGDILQKDFVDVYANLTLKTMMGMEWVQHFCPEASFVMKTDSDMFINVPYLVELLLRRNRTRRFFTGFLKMNELPIRAKYSKWFISRHEYPGDRYPPFCSGTGYVFSSDVAGLVFNVSENVPYIKLEDVFVGLCLQQVGIVPEALHSQQTFFPEGLPFSICRFRRLVACHHVKPQNILRYWKALESSQGEKCPLA